MEKLQKKISELESVNEKTKHLDHDTFSKYGLKGIFGVNLVLSPSLDADQLTTF